MADKAKDGSGVKLADLPAYGNRYNFHLEGVVDCPEFLVSFPVLMELAGKYGLDLAGKQVFESHFKSKRGTDEGRQLLERIKALEPYPPYNPHTQLAGCDDEEHNYRVARDFIRLYESRDPNPGQAGEPIYLSERNKAKRPLHVGTMSRDEWEAATIYTTFAFKKRSDAT